MYQHGYGVVRIIIVGNSDASYYLGKYLSGNLGSGYKIVGIVANQKHIYKDLLSKRYNTLSTAIDRTDPHAIIQTDNENVAKIYGLAIENHLDYQFIPTHEALFSAKHSVGLLGAFPIINVHTTPLIGYGRAVKRIMDVAGSLLGILLLSPVFLVLAILLKITEPRGKVIFTQKRLSRFNKPIYIYKFRSHKLAYNGMSPEDAFAKMGKPELIKQYRDNGDQLDSDPRATGLGNFMRRTSLDELPQLINVLRGDISLVGPRALVPAELKDYEFKSLILSVKSGLTGLAQISGRRDISFEERRKLDMYYVQNWSIMMDLQIILRTIYSVFTGKGAN